MHAVFRRTHSHEASCGKDGAGEETSYRKKRVKGRLEGLCLDGAKAVAAGPRAWLCPQGAASSGLSKQAKLLPCPLCPSPAAKGWCSWICPPAAPHIPAPSWLGWECQRQPKAVSSGKDAGSWRGRTGLGLPSAEVELTLFSTSSGLLPTLTSQEVSSGEQEPSLSPCQGSPAQFPGQDNPRACL